MSNQTKLHLGLTLVWGSIAFTFVVIALALAYRYIILEYISDETFVIILLVTIFLCLVSAFGGTSLYPIMFLPSKYLYLILKPDEKSFIKAVPNNKYSEFDLDALDLLSLDKLEFELKDGVFYTSRNGNNIKIDMKGWLRKKFYLYSLIMTYIKTTYENDIPEGYSLKLVIKYKNKEKTYNLIKDGSLSESMIFKSEYNEKEWLLTELKKPLVFELFYNFNKEEIITKEDK